MKNTVWLGALGALCLVVAAFAFSSWTPWVADTAETLQPKPVPGYKTGDDPKVDENLNAINSLIDEFNRGGGESRVDTRSNRGTRINQAFVALTGEAVNPLFGVTALGMWHYFKAPDHLRDNLPLYDQPVVWLPLLCLILLMLFNSTICETMPFLKVPLNALGDIVNKAGAVVVLPLIIKMFADAVSEPATRQVAYVVNTVFPSAMAAQSGLVDSAVTSAGWLLGAAVGFVVYAAVWLTFNVVDVLILICPFPGVDATLKGARLAIMGVLMGTNQVEPTTALIIAVALTLVCLLLAGWSFRLSVFGLIFSTDILFFRKQDAGDVKRDIKAFSCAGMKHHFKVPMRTWGRLEKDPDGGLVFIYRPWLVLPEKKTVVGDNPAEFAAGRGLLNPFLVADSEPDTPWLRLPPRYRGQEESLGSRLGLKRVVDCGMSGAIRTWLGQLFGKSAAKPTVPAGAETVAVK